MKIYLCTPTIKLYESLGNLIQTAEKGTVKPDKYIVIDNDAKKNTFKKIKNSLKEYVNAKKELPIEKIEIIEPDYNLGVAGSWNYFMKNYADEILIISNDDIELGEKSIEKFKNGIKENINDVVTAEDIGEENQFSFFYMPKNLYQTIGEFDENFYPIYHEDCDYKNRLKNNNKKIISLKNIGLAHYKSALIKENTEEEMEKHHKNFLKNKEYYIKKWGGEFKQEKYQIPFNGKEKEIIVAFPTIKRYDLLEKAIMLIEQGELVPDKYVILDNGANIEREDLKIKGFKQYIQSIEHNLPMNKIEIIEPENNLGVAGSWNYFMENYIDEILIISNDDIEFFKNTIKTMVETRKNIQNENILIYTCNQYENNAFCLFSPLKKTIKVLGEFDENFYPAYYEDCDYNRRLILTKKYTFLTVKECTFKHLESSTFKSYNEEEKQKHHKNFLKNKEYYIKKWGGDLEEEKYKKPFNR